jgi:hypothetical protein
VNRASGIDTKESVSCNTLSSLPRHVDDRWRIDRSKGFVTALTDVGIHPFPI